MTITLQDEAFDHVRADVRNAAHQLGTLRAAARLAHVHYTDAATTNVDMCRAKG